MGLYVFKSTTLTFRISLRLLTQLKTLSGFTSGWRAHAQRETPLVHCPHPLMNTSRATIAKRCVCFCASFLSSILIMCGCVLWIVCVRFRRTKRGKRRRRQPSRISQTQRLCGLACERVWVCAVCGCGCVSCVGVGGLWVGESVTKKRESQFAHLVTINLAHCANKHAKS